MSYDFFHTEPYLSMAIDSRDDLETTVLLLVAGLLVGTIASKGRSARHRETATRVEVRRLHRVAEATATGQPPKAVLDIAQDEITALLDLADCWFEPAPYTDDPTRPRLGRNGAIQAQSCFRFRRDRDGRTGFELPPEGVDVHVLARGHYVGRLVLVPNPNTATTVDDRLITVTIADQVGAAWPIPPDVPQSATGMRSAARLDGGTVERGAHERTRARREDVPAGTCRPVRQRRCAGGHENPDERRCRTPASCITAGIAPEKRNIRSRLRDELTR